MSKIVRKVFKMLKTLLKISMSLLSLLFCYALVLLGLGMMFTPAPMPGVSREIQAIVGLILVGIGGALLKIRDIKDRARITARVYKEEGL